MDIAMPSALVQQFGATVVSQMDKAIVLSGAPRRWIVMSPHSND